MNISTHEKYKENVKPTFFGKNERLNLIEEESIRESIYIPNFLGTILASILIFKAEKFIKTAEKKTKEIWLEMGNKMPREMRINISRKIRGYLFRICSNREHRGGENYGDI
jgi:hypothetical protein